MNKIVLIGRLTKDPTLKIIEETQKVVSRFTLAVERPFKNNEGEKQVDFIPVVFFGKKAEIVKEYMVKGRLISVSGRLQMRSYNDSEGKKKYVAEVLADEFQFIDSKKLAENIG